MTIAVYWNVKHQIKQRNKTITVIMSFHLVVKMKFSHFITSLIASKIFLKKDFIKIYGNCPKVIFPSVVYLYSLSI